MRADRFEQALGLEGVRIYYKYEGGSPSGSHKPNTAVPQAFYCAAGRPQAHRDGDRRGSVGLGTLVSDAALRARTRGLHGAGISYRAEAVQARDDADVRSDRPYSSPSPRDECRPGGPRRASPTRSDRWGIAISEAVERAATDPEAANYSLGSRAQPRAHAPDRDRPRGQGAACDAGEEPGRRHRLRRGRLELRRHLVPVPAATRSRRRRDRDHRRRAGLVPDADTAASTPTTTATHRHGAARGHAHAGTRLHASGHPRRRPALSRPMAPLVSHAQNEGCIRAEAYGQLECFARGHPVRQRPRASCRRPSPPMRSGARSRAPGARGVRQGAGDPVQPLRSRALRHAGLRRLLSGRLQDHEMPEDERDRALAAIADFPAAPAAV